MKKILFSFSLLLICFSYINVSAIDACTTSEMTRLRELANNVEISYTYEIEIFEEENIFLIYDLQVLNLHSDLKISYENKNSNEIIFLNNNNPTINGLGENETLIFYIYAYTDNMCVDTLLRTITVNLPIYNNYYYFNKERCEEYSDFEYCQEFMDVSDLSFEEIDNKFNEYLESLRIDKFADTFKNNYIYVIIGGVLILTIVVIIVIKKQKVKKDSDLQVIF